MEEFLLRPVRFPNTSVLLAAGLDKLVDHTYNEHKRDTVTTYQRRQKLVASRERAKFGDSTCGDLGVARVETVIKTKLCGSIYLHEVNT